MKKNHVVFLLLQVIRMLAMEPGANEPNRDLVKEWSQIKEDVKYGKTFLKEHEKVSPSRKKTELIRFLNSWNHLNEHQDEFIDLQYDKKLISKSNVIKKLNSLADIHDRIDDLPLRRHGEKRITMPSNMTNMVANPNNNNFTFVTENPQNNNSTEFNIDLTSLFDQNMPESSDQYEEETDPLLYQNNIYEEDEHFTRTPNSPDHQNTEDENENNQNQNMDPHAHPYVQLMELDEQETHSASNNQNPSEFDDIR